MTKEQENIRIVQQAYAAFLHGDMQALMNMYADDVDFFIPEPGEIFRFTGRRCGRQEVAQFFASLAESEDVEFEPREFFAQGDKVVVLGHWRSRVKSTGSVLELDLAHVHTLREGKLVAFYS